MAGRKSRKGVLYIGLDPGGTGKKWAGITACYDGSPLYIGLLKTKGAERVSLASKRFPFLDEESKKAIHKCLDDALLDLAEAVEGKRPGSATKGLDAAKRCFDRIVIGMDAPCGFAVGGEGRRDTEKEAGPNFNTPSEQEFLKKASLWEKKPNTTPLNQRVYWKLVGFAIYGYFTGAKSAKALAAKAAEGLEGDRFVRPKRPASIRIREAFPSDIYTERGERYLEEVRGIAERGIADLESAGLHPATKRVFENQLLAKIILGDMKAWNRCSGLKGDILDAFAAMMIGVWEDKQMVKACTSNPDLAKQEGVIVVPG